MEHVSYKSHAILMFWVPSKGAKLCKEEGFLIHGRFSGNGKGEIEACHEHSWSENRDYISL